MLRFPKYSTNDPIRFCYENFVVTLFLIHPPKLLANQQTQIHMRPIAEMGQVEVYISHYEFAEFKALEEPKTRLPSNFQGEISIRVIY